MTKRLTKEREEEIRQWAQFIEPNMTSNPVYELISEIDELRDDNEYLEINNKIHKRDLNLLRQHFQGMLIKLEAENEKLKNEIQGRIKERLSDQLKMIDLEKRIAGLRRVLQTIGKAADMKGTLLRDYLSNIVNKTLAQDDACIASEAKSIHSEKDVSIRIPEDEL